MTNIIKPILLRIDINMNWVKQANQKQNGKQNFNKLAYVTEQCAHFFSHQTIAEKLCESNTFTTIYIATSI